MFAEKDNEQPEGSPTFSGDPEVPASLISARSGDDYPEKIFTALFAFENSDY